MAEQTALSIAERLLALEERVARLEAGQPGAGSTATVQMEEAGAGRRGKKKGSEEVTPEEGAEMP
ncbi:MAG: hypothetical protein R6W76_19505 [Caldilinea sp.]